MPIINTIISGGGTQPTGTVSITTNGITNVAPYEYADVQVPTSAPTHYIERVNNGGTLTSVTFNGASINLNGISIIGEHALMYAYKDSDLQAPSDFSGITEIKNQGLQYCYYGCGNLTTPPDFSSLTTVQANGLNYAFSNTPNMTGTVDFASLTDIKNNGINKCFQTSGITGFKADALITITGGSTEKYQFYQVCNDCPDLVSASFANLETVESDAAFFEAFKTSGLSSLDLGKLKYVEPSSGITATYGFQLAFAETALTTFSLPELLTIGYEPISYSVVTSGSNYVFNKCCNKCNSLTTISMPKLEFIGGAYTFQEAFTECPQLQTVDISGLENIYGNDTFTSAFEGDANLTSVDMSKLRYINSNNAFRKTFYNCASLSTFDNNIEFVHGNDVFYTTFFGTALTENPLKKLRVIQGEHPFGQIGFTGGALTDGTFPKLQLIILSTQVFNYVFNNSRNITKLDFPCLVRATMTYDGSVYTIFDKVFGSGSSFNSIHDIRFPMLQEFGGQNNTFTAMSFKTATGNNLTLHFRMDAQSQITTKVGYSSNFGATAIAFDLVGKITVNGVDYLREEIESQTGYTAWHKAASTITVSGTTYTYDQPKISRFYGTPFIGVPTILYAWYDGTTRIFTDKLTPDVGDFIYTSATTQSTTDTVSAVSTDFVYTDDSAEAQVGDNVYSDQGVTLVGTVSAIA